MSKRRRGLTPYLELLQGRVVCSGLLPVASANALTALAAVNKTVSLHGTLHGHLQAEVGIPDAGRTYSSSGAGFLAGLGRTAVAGDLRTTGFIAQGHAQGTLTLTLAGGTMTLQLTGVPVQSGFAALPSTFTYTVTSGTGHYRNVSDHGIATLTTTSGNGSQQGAFTLTLSSSISKMAAPVMPFAR